MVEQIAAANSWLNGYVWGGPMIGWLVFIYLGGIGSLHLVWDVADTLTG